MKNHAKKMIQVVCAVSVCVLAGCGAVEVGELEQEQNIEASGPNLKVEDITQVAYCNTSNKCSVELQTKVCNRGTSASGSSGFTVAAKGWGSATIWTCTGYWQSTNTTTNLNAGSCRTVVVYGPGYVGPKVTKGSSFTFTAYADARCNTAESNEGDNAYAETIRVGY